VQSVPERNRGIVTPCARGAERVARQVAAREAAAMPRRAECEPDFLSRTVLIVRRRTRCGPATLLAGGLRGPMIRPGVDAVVTLTNQRSSDIFRRKRLPITVSLRFSIGLEDALQFPRCVAGRLY
jgi:hypothetical protein